MGRKANRRELQAALDAGEPVLARRNLWKADHLEGFVVEVAADWAVLNLVFDVGLNGWSVVRLDTIRDVERKGPEAFVSRALAYRGEVPEAIDVDLDTPAALLRSAATAFPVITLYTEADDPTVCAIGRPQRITSKHVELLDVSTEATWEAEPRRFRLDDVTRVDLGGEYETMLHHLAGYPPVP